MSLQHGIVLESIPVQEIRIYYPISHKIVSSYTSVILTMCAQVSNISHRKQYPAITKNNREVVILVGNKCVLTNVDEVERNISCLIHAVVREYKGESEVRCSNLSKMSKAIKNNCNRNGLTQVLVLR